MRPERSALSRLGGLALAGLTLLGGGPVGFAERAGAAPAGPIVTPTDRALDPEALLLEIGALARTQGIAAARARLATLTSLEAPGDALARTVAGLLAHAQDDPGAAIGLLDFEGAPSELDDWRLEVLADSLAARGERDRARDALLALLSRHPESPLRADAIVRLAGLAWESKRTDEARTRIAQGRAENLPRARAVELERLAWQIAVAARDAAALRESAHRLLVLDPLEASKMRVVDAVAAQGGGADWRLWLAPDELVARAAALLDSDLPAGALTTLAAVPAVARKFEWRLLEGRALFASGRPVDAFSALALASSTTALEQAELDWERARAAGAAADPSRTGALPAEERGRYRRLERERLLAVARGASGTPDARDAADSAPLRALEKRALARLAKSYLEESRRDEALAALRQLATLDPTDTTGARPLWESGWQAYRRGEPRAAIESWRQLSTLYPRSGWSRSGAYWTARALERLGDAAGARRQYLVVVGAGVADFYARQAGLKLAGAEAGVVQAPAPDPWPNDPRIARARRLTDLGLDALAAAELERVAPDDSSRAVSALSGLILARRGERRDSLRQLKRAFPELGTALQTSVPRDALALYYPLDFRTSIERAATLERLSPALVFGMVHQESGFDPSAKSHAGARGLMQLMPATGREVAGKLGLPFSYARLEEPDYSLRLGTNYFQRVQRMFGGNVELALAAYNGGPGRIGRLWRAEGPSPELDHFLEELALEESRNYVKRIVVLADSYRSLYPDLG